MLNPEAYVAQPAPGRACGACTLCCKVYDVPAVESVAGTWCRHTRAGQGCAIHATRPDHCRAFHCLWMTEGWLGPEWKPDRAKMVLSLDPLTRNMNVQVDPGQAGAWRREPYYGQLKRWAVASVPSSLPQRRRARPLLPRRPARSRPSWCSRMRDRPRRSPSP